MSRKEKLFVALAVFQGFASMAALMRGHPIASDFMLLLMVASLIEFVRAK